MRPFATVCLLLMATAVFAASPTITPMDQAAGREATIGNPYADNAGGAYDDFWLGGEEFAVLVNAGHGHFPYPDGFTVTEVEMLIGLDATANLQVQGAILAAVEDNGTFTPGDELYATDVYTLTDIPEEGFYTIGLPAESQAFTADTHYFIVFRFLDDNAESVGIAVDDSPSTGYGYCDSGFGWLDLVDYFGLAGDVYVSAKVDAAQIVATESHSWTGVKTLFD